MIIKEDEKEVLCLDMSDVYALHAELKQTILFPIYNKEMDGPRPNKTLDRLVNAIGLLAGKD